MSVVGAPNLSEHNLKPAGERYLYSATPWFFTLQDLDRLKPLVSETKPATVVEREGGPNLNADRRSSLTSFIEPNQDTAWLYQKIGDALRYHNQTHYGFDLTGIEHLQFTEYPEGAGYYGPHLDWGSGAIMGRHDICRKLSFTIQLSNPDSYEGGDFVIRNGESFEEQSAKVRQFGTLIVFPSWVLHEVTPVTRGCRRSLVGWSVGPEFR